MSSYTSFVANIFHLHMTAHPLTHFQDYDCFYASVFEAENPALKSQPLAVVQKNIIVTCNYPARTRVGTDYFRVTVCGMFDAVDAGMIGTL